MSLLYKCVATLFIPLYNCVGAAGVFPLLRRSTCHYYISGSEHVSFHCTITSEHVSLTQKARRSQCRFTIIASELVSLHNKCVGARVVSLYLRQNMFHQLSLYTVSASEHVSFYYNVVRAWVTYIIIASEHVSFHYTCIGARDTCSDTIVLQCHVLRCNYSGTILVPTRT